MQAIDVFVNRRSCKKYSDKQVEKDKLSAILKAGTYAPTGKNRQSPVIVVIQNKEVIKRVERLNALALGEEKNVNPFYNAPTLLIVFADSTIDTYLYDGNMVMANLLNSATAVGVDSCFIFRAKEVFSSKEGIALKKEWGLDEKYEGIGNCILGYSAETKIKERAKRKDNYIIEVK